MLRPESHARSVVRPKPPLFILLFLDHQPLTPPNPLDSLVVHTPACVVEQACHHPISKAPVLIGQLDDVIGQTPFIDPALRHLALRGSILTKCAAGAAFRCAKLPPHMVYALVSDEGSVLDALAQTETLDYQAQTRRLLL